MICMLVVRRFAAEDVPAATAIIRGLPDYFTDDVAAKVERDAARGEAWVLTDSGLVTALAVVEAKTLDASAGCRPYEATRAFWERSGFVQVDTIDPLPDWGPGSSAAIYVAALRTTR
jgi:hypothetical protein